MKKVTAPLVITLSWFGCAGPVPPKQVDDAPIEEETSAPEEEASPTAEEPTAETPAETETPAEPDPPAGTVKEESPTGPKECATLPKGTCEVTEGCAWNSISKCVEE